MRLLNLCVIFLFCTHLYCQEAIDSSAVKFKAKLLTASEYGIAGKDQILKDIEGQKVTFLKTKYNNFSFLKIEFSQPNRTSDKSSLTLVRNCSYYLAFNLQKKKFYKLGGFDAVDIDAFITDLELSEGANVIDWGDRNEVEGIDMDCFYDYFKLSKKNRLKRKFNCFENCAENTKTYYIEH